MFHSSHSKATKAMCQTNIIAHIIVRRCFTRMKKGVRPKNQLLFERNQTLDPVTMIHLHQPLKFKSRLRIVSRANCLFQMKKDQTLKLIHISQVNNNLSIQNNFHSVPKLISTIQNTCNPRNKKKSLIMQFILTTQRLITFTKV